MSMRADGVHPESGDGGASVTVRAYGELNDLLPLERRHRDSVTALNGTPAVKDPIEALGIPHTEVDLILVDGEPVGLDHRVVAGARIAVFPRFRRVRLPATMALIPAPTQPVRFVADVHLGTLARQLRLLGFDTRWTSDADDEWLARCASREGRVLLTRDRGLLKRSVVTRGLLLRDDDPFDQTVDVLRTLELADEIRPFGRCTACNDVPVAVDKDEVLHRLEPATRREHTSFRRCPGCDRIYWPGSHHDQLTALVDRLRAAV